MPTRSCEMPLSINISPIKTCITSQPDCLRGADKESPVCKSWVSDPHVEASGADACSGLNLITGLELRVLFLPSAALLWQDEWAELNLD